MNRLVLLGLMLSAFRPPWGITSFDTKTDLWVNPGAFLARSLHLWNPQASFGELQNQAYGYLFPQGSFAFLGAWVGLPTWFVERSWEGLLLISAYSGARLCFRHLRSTPMPWGQELGAVVAGLAFVGAPRLVGIVGSISSEATPPAVLPWALLPVLLHARGRLSARAAGLATGLAVLCMGGVNAVATLECFPLLALALLLADGIRHRARLGAWMALGVGLASTWWLAPLVVLGRYSPPFLDYIETSDATTGPLGWTNVLRGADHWVAFTTVGGKPWWPGAFALHASVLGVLASGGVAAAGLAGLCLRKLPQRRLLVAGTAVGVAALVAGHGGWLGSPLAVPTRWLLDGPLALLRNVHKVDPVARLPMCLAAGYAVERCHARFGQRRRVSPSVARRQGVRAASALLGAMVALPLVLAPAHSPGWRDYPPAWRAASAAAAGAAQGLATLVLPSASFGQQTWGWTVDEPIQPVAAGPWVSRSQVPLAPPQTIRFLDALTARAEDGEGPVATELARAGIGAVILRRDLDPAVLDPAVTERVAAALDRTPGVERIGEFGRSGSHAEVQVYAVRPTGDRVAVTDAAAVKRVQGGPEDVVAAVELGAVDAVTPTVMVGDSAPLGDNTDADIIGDGYARRERAFGSVRDALGPVLTAGQAFSTDRRVHDYPGSPGAAPVVAAYTGVSDVTASSSAADADVLGPLRPEYGAQAAVDGNPLTQWRSAAQFRPDDQWLQLTLPGATALPYVDVVAGVNPLEQVPVRDLTVTTDDGQRVVGSVDATSGRVRIPLSGSPVRWVRVAVSRTFLDPAVGTVAISEIALPGVDIQRRLVVPQGPSVADPAFVLRDDPVRRACWKGVFVSCNLASARGMTESQGLARQLSLSQPATFTVTGRVRALATPQAAQLLGPLPPGPSVVADSVYGSDPAVAGSFAMDGDPSTVWLAQPYAAVATLSVRLQKQHTITSLAVRGGSGRAALPTHAVVSNGTQSRTVALGGGAPTSFEALSGRNFTVTMSGAAPGALPLGAGEVVLGGAQDQVFRPDVLGPTGAICGLGPRMVVDGVVHETQVRGHISDVIDGTDLALLPCDGPLTLSAGTHEIRLEPNDRFAAYEVGLEPQDAARGGTTRHVTVDAWQATTRRVDVGPGATSVMSVAENYNLGWSAQLNGAKLAPIRLDGWRQGFVIPEGAGGMVTMSFGPDGVYRWALLSGGVLAGALVAAALSFLLRDLRRQEPDFTRAPGGHSLRAPLPRVVTLGAVVLIGGVAPALGLLAWRLPVVRQHVVQVVLGLFSASVVLAAVNVATGGSAAFTPWWVDLPAGMAVGVGSCAIILRGFTAPRHPPTSVTRVSS